MDARALLNGVPRAVRSLVGSDLRACTASTGFGLIKLHYGNQKLHYEANHQARSRTIEIGLHFEADAFTNTRLLGAFRIHQKRIHRELPGARLEEWDKGWARIWEPIPYEELDAALQRDVAARIARYISVLEPILREELPADVAWTLPSRAASARRVRSTSPRASARRSPTPRNRSG
ncbi:MAG: hypothetical protein ACRDGT_09135 [Candidatus Limnocylindria bacterium]